MAYDDIWRIASSRLLAVSSSGGVAASTASVAAQTYAVELTALGIVTSTGGVRYAIGESPVADSTSALLPFNWPLIRKVGPGQKISALSNDAILPSLTIVELTK